MACCSLDDYARHELASGKSITRLDIDLIGKSHAVSVNLVRIKLEIICNW